MAGAIAEGVGVAVEQGTGCWWDASAEEEAEVAKAMFATAAQAAEVLVARTGLAARV